MKTISLCAAFAFVGPPAISMAQTASQGVTTVVGCYVARPALSYSGNSEPESADTVRAYVNFLPNGVVALPFVRSGLDQESTWTLSGDSLTVRIRDGFTRWTLHLIRISGGFNGTATYPGEAGRGSYQPPSHPITLTATARSCSLNR